MQIIETIYEMQQKVLSLKKQSLQIGFVPTMGYLHEGHLSLIKKSKSENDITVISIFVNPLQFGPKEDLSTYPRDFERDYQLAMNEGVDFLFYPSVSEMYPIEPSVLVTVTDRTDVLCGKSRPGHFDGVATVLTKLFHIILPDKAYFGLKDAQQVAVVDGLINDFHFPIELVPVETIREEDGLAKSSRNVFLTENERREAPFLYKSLLLAKQKIVLGEQENNQIVSFMKTYIQENTSGVVDYIEIYSYPQLKPVTGLEQKLIIALAVKFSKARLIDNIIIQLNK
ncbi:pantoate--beta-alanine ligase [Pseudoneobacillus rhizosphaerae]|uniref:Pantothenate synthetase n=1 Tax=Pseudoneobacillus rhizosphaerae TaxID=2880968 RepID=A0A9C7LB89_9BACI|nr:pantoate--beta-alanine ligase [Pseudoneobacillus rhizosphaerae]CAG9608280.1 Pantothenate synthetase [Pseudoneobacillus rhizosphaerae]